MKFFCPLKYYTLVIYHHFVPDTNEIETNNQDQILKLIYMSFFELIALCFLLGHDEVCSVLLRPCPQCCAQG